jgi:hypothetical protein
MDVSGQLHGPDCVRYPLARRFDGCEWSASRPGLFVFGIHWVGGSMDF